MVLGDLNSNMQRKETQSPTYTITKINSRWIKELNISCNTTIAIEENINRKISGILRSNIFTNISSRARDIKERINKWDLIKLKSFCEATEHNSKMKREPIVRENTFANDTSDKGMISKIHKQLIQFYSRKTNNPI